MDTKKVKTLQEFGEIMVEDIDNFILNDTEISNILAEGYVVTLTVNNEGSKVEVTKADHGPEVKQEAANEPGSVEVQG